MYEYLLSKIEQWELRLAENQIQSSLGIFTKALDGLRKSNARLFKAMDSSCIREINLRNKASREAELQNSLNVKVASTFSQIEKLEKFLA